MCGHQPSPQKNGDWGSEGLTVSLHIVQPPALEAKVDEVPEPLGQIFLHCRVGMIDIRGGSIVVTALGRSLPTIVGVVAADGPGLPLELPSKHIPASLLVLQ